VGAPHDGNLASHAMVLRERRYLVLLRTGVWILRSDERRFHPGLRQLDFKKERFQEGSATLIPNVSRRAFSDGAIRNAVDRMLCLQQSYAALPAAGVEERIKALSALCMTLDSIDDVLIHRVDWLMGSAIPDSFTAGADGTSKSRKGLTYRGDFQEEKAVFSRFLAQDPRLAKVMATPLVTDMRDRMRAIYCVALAIPGRVIGILCAGTRNPDGFQAGIRLALDLLAPQLALLIENARLSRPSKDLAAASQDPAEPIPRDSRSASLANLLARLAHDIKNPLTAISTFMQLFPTRWNDDHFRATFYPVALDETERLLGLVQDMLDRGKKQSARLMPVDMQDLVANLVGLLAPLAEQRQLTLSTQFAQASSVIRVDEGKIKEAIHNILTNAMEAAPETGHIDIRLDGIVLPGGRPAIRLEIQDSGPGVDEALKAEIFDPYMSTKDARPLSGGTGLGLYIARQNIQAHGGMIEVENADAGGALFRVILPVERRRR
jgi:signal transduction histidine kinase